MTLSARWPEPTPVEEVLDRVNTEGILVHAAAHQSDDLTLCELDGPRLPGDDNVRLNLSSPGARELRDTVTCPGCVAWMRA